MEDKTIKPFKDNKIRTAAEVAEALVNHAKFKSEQLLTEANRQASILAAQAEQDGLEKGQKKAFASIISGESLLAEIMQSAKELIIELAIEIAQEILQYELKTNPQALLPRVEHLLAKALNARKIKIYTNNSISNEIENKISHFPESKRIVVIADKTLDLGDIRISTELGEITSKIDTELKNISTTLSTNSDKIFK